jgi:hypothetical protein
LHVATDFFRILLLSKHGKFGCVKFVTSSVLWNITTVTQNAGLGGGVVVKALRYQSDGAGIDSRWCHWIFQ